jgi:hypothetical protein
MRGLNDGGAHGVTRPTRIVCERHNLASSHIFQPTFSSRATGDGAAQLPSEALRLCAFALKIFCLVLV